MSPKENIADFVPEDPLWKTLRQLYKSEAIVNWKGVKDAEGKEIPYSPSVAEDFLQTVFFPDRSIQ